MIIGVFAHVSPKLGRGRNVSTFRTNPKMKKSILAWKSAFLTAISARYINVYGKNKLTFPSSFQIEVLEFSLFPSC